MAVPQHPMRALKGTPQGRDLMANVRAHRSTTKKAAPVADGNFIKDAIKRPGALTAKAKAAGMSVEAFARAHQHDKGVTGDEARFYLNVLAKTPSGEKAAAKPAKKSSSQKYDDIIAAHAARIPKGS